MRAYAGNKLVFDAEKGHTIALLTDPANSGTVSGGGTYPEGAQVTVTATPGSGYEFMEWREKVVSRLPDGYVELSYIQSSGTQYINTQFNPTTETTVILDVDCGAYSSTAWLFGARDSTETTAEFQYLIARTADKRLAMRYFGGSNNLANIEGLSERTVIAQEKNKLSSGGVSVEADKPVEVKSCSYPMYLFTYNNIGKVGARCSAKLYSCQIYDGETLVRDFVPCSDSSGAVGLYDLVNRAFYGNAGTGAFSTGQVVSTDPVYTFTATKSLILTAAFQEAWEGRLPRGYTEVQYIEASSTGCYVILGLGLDSTTVSKSRFVFDIQVGDYGSSNGTTEYLLDGDSGATFFYLGRTSNTQIENGICRSNLDRPTTISVNIANKRVAIDCNVKEGRLRKH